MIVSLSAFQFSSLKERRSELSDKLLTSVMQDSEHKAPQISSAETNYNLRKPRQFTGLNKARTNRLRNTLLLQR